MWGVTGFIFGKKSADKKDDDKSSSYIKSNTRQHDKDEYLSHEDKDIIINKEMNNAYIIAPPTIRERQIDTKDKYLAYRGAVCHFTPVYILLILLLFLSS